MNFLIFKLVLEKAEEPEIKLPTSAGSWKKQESSRKTSISALLTMPNPLTVWVTSWEIDEETVETVADFILFLAPKSLQMVIAAMKLKDACSLEYIV